MIPIIQDDEEAIPGDMPPRGESVSTHCFVDSVNAGFPTSSRGGERGFGQGKVCPHARGTGTHLKETK